MATNVTVTGTTATVTDNGATVVVTAASTSTPAWGAISGTLANQADLTTALAGKVTTPGAWTSFSPTWSSTGTPPSLGNGTIVAAYSQVGKVVVCRCKITFGSTTTAGTGVYHLTLPVTAKSGYIPNADGQAQDISTGAIRRAAAVVADTGLVYLTWYDSTFNYLTGTSPYTWAVDDFIEVTFMYEAA